MSGPLGVSLQVINQHIQARVWNKYYPSRRTDAQKETAVVSVLFSGAFYNDRDIIVLRHMTRSDPDMLEFGADGMQLLNLYNFPRPSTIAAEKRERLYNAVSYTWRYATDRNLEGTVAILREEGAGEAFISLVSLVIEWRQNIRSMYHTLQISDAITNYVKHARVEPPIHIGFSLDFYVDATERIDFAHKLFNEFPTMPAPGSMCEYFCLLYCRLQTKKRRNNVPNWTQCLSLAENPPTHARITWKHYTDIRCIYVAVRAFLCHNKTTRALQNITMSRVREHFVKWLQTSKRHVVEQIMETSVIFNNTTHSCFKAWNLFERIIYIYVTYDSSRPHEKQNKRQRKKQRKKRKIEAK
jgi:hypothetical protein